MKTIYKYRLPELGINELKTYVDSVVLSAKEQDNDIVVYLLVDTRLPLVEVKFTVIPTGRPNMDYIGNPTKAHAETYVDTVMLDGGNLVHHVFSLDLPVAK